MLKAISDFIYSLGDWGPIAGILLFIFIWYVVARAFSYGDHALYRSSEKTDYYTRHRTGN